MWPLFTSVSLLSVTSQEGSGTTRGEKEPEPGDQDIPDHPRTDLIVGMVFLILLLILVGVLVLVRYKFPRIKECCAAGVSSEQSTNAGQNREGNHADHADEEIQMQNQQAGLGDVVPYICANVKPPSNQLHYATVNFQKDSVSVWTDGIALPDMNKNGSSACDYSSVSRTQGATHRPAPEQHLYSTVIVPEKP
ncbi:uncharacterized protein LOC109139659 isoform X2 [Larimichthys crocea]|uniref:uncharacterized protein LOC109139659 isoform X2 n=1 Tax=Larimichthys crocea TaxID=215358 RepID=UPI0009008542|nr:uncharacterized protein LOC109139659 isoform X2 [Larimichthys crocea]XP_027138157.1 uncharacterized protein LOC109139659 isoform X2 [Larimichthys crocea]